MPQDKVENGNSLVGQRHGFTQWLRNKFCCGKRILSPTDMSLLAWEKGWKSELANVLTSVALRLLCMYKFDMASDVSILADDSDHYLPIKVRSGPCWSRQLHIDGLITFTEFSFITKQIFKCVGWIRIRLLLIGLIVVSLNPFQFVGKCSYYILSYHSMIV